MILFSIGYHSYPSLFLAQMEFVHFPYVLQKGCEANVVDTINIFIPPLSFFLNGINAPQLIFTQFAPKYLNFITASSSILCITKQETWGKGLKTACSIHDTFLCHENCRWNPVSPWFLLSGVIFRNNLWGPKNIT